MVERVARYGLGLIFVVFGLNYFFQFLPMPAVSAEGGALLGALINTGYLFTLIKVIEIVAGVLLLANRYINLAVILIAPIVLNILLFHILLDSSGLPMGLLITVLWGILFVRRKDEYSNLLKP